MKDKRQCVSCGAPIPHGAMRCEYCGMEYEPDYWAGTLRYVPIHVKSRKLVAQTEVPNYLLAMNKDAIADQVHRDITHQITEGLTEMITLRVSTDWINEVTIVRGELWVEEPYGPTAFNE